MSFKVGQYIRYVCGGPGPDYGYGIILKDSGDEYIIYDGLYRFGCTVSKKQNFFPLVTMTEEEVSRFNYSEFPLNGPMITRNLKAECEAILPKSEEIVKTIEVGGRWPLKYVD